MESVLDLGNGLELWRVDVDDAREQDDNARAMPKAMMERLAATIGRDGRLESLPFCAVTKEPGEEESKLEIISGHHRFRAARAAGVSPIYVIADVTGLSRSEIAAKQLAHNSIQGDDDPQIVKKIFEKIAEVHLKLETFIDPEKISFKLDRVSVGQLQIGIQYESVVINFFPTERQRFDQALEALMSRLNEREIVAMHVSVLEAFEQFRTALARTKKEYDIRATGTALDEMSRMVLEALGEPDVHATDEEMVPLRTVFGLTVLPTKLANKLKKRIKGDIEDGKYAKEETWRLLEAL